MPPKKGRKKGSSVVQKLPEYLDRDKMKELLKVAKNYCQRDYVLISFMFNTGMRISEVLSVTPRDIDFRSGFLTILHGKGGKQRRIPVPKPMMELLTEYITENNIGKNECIFPIGHRRAYRIIRSYGAYIDEKLHPHMLRHSYAVNLVREGVDLRRVQMLMGHSNLDTTAIYLQFDDEDLREAIDKASFG